MEKEMATHSSILAWRVPWTEEPGGLLSIGLHRVGHNWSNLACMHALEKEMATHSSILDWRIPGTEESGGLPSMGSHRVGDDWGDLAGAVAACYIWLWKRKENILVLPTVKIGLVFIELLINVSDNWNTTEATVIELNIIWILIISS